MLAWLVLVIRLNQIRRPILANSILRCVQSQTNSNICVCVCACRSSCFSGRCAACKTLPSRAEAKLSDECGDRFALSEAEGQARSRSSCRPLVIQCFTVDCDVQLRFHEDDWDGLRAAVTAACARASAVKEEADDSSDEGFVQSTSGEIVVVDNLADHVLALQANISRKFRNGDKLQTLVRALRNSEVDPMTTDWLILKVAVAKVGNRRSGRTLRYYTFDHRRLWCLYQAGCKRIRVQIAMCGGIIDEFARKADGLGRKVSELDFRL